MFYNLFTKQKNTIIFLIYMYHIFYKTFVSFLFIYETYIPQILLTKKMCPHFWLLNVWTIIFGTYFKRWWCPNKHCCLLPYDLIAVSTGRGWMDSWGSWGSGWVHRGSTWDFTCWWNWTRVALNKQERWRHKY